MYNLITVDEFIKNVDKYLSTNEIVSFGCDTCDCGSQYGVEYEIHIPETGEYYSISTVEQYSHKVFTKRSLMYFENQTLNNLIENLEIVDEDDFINNYLEKETTPFFVPNKNIFYDGWK